MTGACTWSAKAALFQCAIRRPKAVETGKAYTITAYQNAGAYVAVPPAGKAVNPETVRFG